MSAPRVIDVHSHLADADFDTDRHDVIARAREAGVVASIVVGECYEDNLRILDLAAREPFVLPALGHHPWRMDIAGDDVPRTLRLLEEHRSMLVAVGEVGLDYRTAEGERERADQRAVFRELVLAAKGLDLPLSVHVRSAGHYVIDLLEELGSPQAALHAFDGKAKYVRKGAALGFHFSIPGTVLASRQKEKLATVVPEGRLLLESDAPALSPDWGARNEPSVISRSLDRIAELRGASPEAVAAAAWENTVSLFALELPGRVRHGS